MCNTCVYHLIKIGAAIGELYVPLYSTMLTYETHRGCLVDLGCVYAFLLAMLVELGTSP